MASASLHCKPINKAASLVAQENAAARGSLDAFFSRKQHSPKESEPAAVAEAAAEAEAEAAVEAEAGSAAKPGQAQMEVEGLASSKSEGEANRILLECNSHMADRPALNGGEIESNSAQLDCCISSQGEEAMEVQGILPMDESVREEDTTLETPTDSEMKSQDVSAAKTQAVNGIFSPEFCGAQVITNVSIRCCNTAISHAAESSFISEEPIGTIVVPDESLPIEFSKESVSVPTKAEAREDAVVATSSAMEGGNVEEVHGRLSSATDNEPRSALIGGYLLRSRETSGKTISSSKQRLKLDLDLKRRVTRKLEINGEESGIDDAMKLNGGIEFTKDEALEASPPHVSNDFFMPTSKKRVKLKEEKTITYNQTSSASRKRRKVTETESSRAKVMTTGIDSSKNLIGRENKLSQCCSMELEGTDVVDSLPLKVDIDLWREAKLAAEENARLSAGRPTHPFFSRQQKSTLINCTSSPQLNVEEVCSDFALPCDLGETPPSLPYHVTQVSQSMENTLNWRNWNLLDVACIFQPEPAETLSRGHKTSDSINYSMLNGSRDGCFPKGLECDVLSSILRMNAEDFSFRDFCSESSFEVHEERSTDGWLRELLKYLKDSNVQSMDKEEAQGWNIHDGNEGLTFEKLKERLSWYLTCRSKVCFVGSSGSFPSFVGEDNVSNGSHNVLWTERYQPSSSKQVCGNKDSLSFLNNWLHSWKLKIACERKTENTEKLYSTSSRSKQFDVNDDRGWFQDDSGDDVTNIEEELCNTVLLTGPVGSGKSAAVYACAKEQGFTVLEINASEGRNGALIKHKFGEAMESHGLSKWSADENVNSSCSPLKGSEKKHLTKFSKGEKEAQMDMTISKVCNGRSKQHEKHAHKQSNLNQDAAIFQNPSMQDCPAEDDTLDFSESQRGRMTLILFEDVDIVFEEDRGFMAALVQLARTTKRPLILTSNKGQPHLPQLEKLVIQFTKPSIVDLVTHIFMVCMSENMPKSPMLIEQLVKLCRHDLRKLMMMLQYWGQSCNVPIQSDVACLVSQDTVENSTQQHAVELPCQNVNCRHCNSAKLCACLSSAFENSGHSLLEEQEIVDTDVKERAGMSKTGPLNSGALEEVLVCKVPPCQQSDIWALRTRLLFASDAQYSVLPHVISLSYPCPLSQGINEKAIQAVQESDRLAESVAAQLAELKVAMRHTKNQKMQKLRKKLKATTDQSPVQEQIITAASNTLLADGADEESLLISAETGTLYGSPLPSARKPRLSKMLRRQKLHQSIVFSDSEDDCSLADILPAELEEKCRYDVLNTCKSESVSVDDKCGFTYSFSNLSEEPSNCENHHELFSVQNHALDNSYDACLTYDKPDAFRRLRRLHSGNTSLLDGKEKGDELTGQTVSCCSDLEYPQASSANSDVPVVLEEITEAQPLETHLSFGTRFLQKTDVPLTAHAFMDKYDTSLENSSNGNWTYYGGTLLSVERLSKEGRYSKEAAHSCDNDIPSTVKVAVPLDDVAECLTTRSPVTEDNTLTIPGSTEEKLTYTNLNPVDKLWSSLLKSKAEAGLNCAQTSLEALEISCLLAEFGDVLSASDVIFTVHEPHVTDSEFAEEVAASLAQIGLGLCLQQYQHVACAHNLINVVEKSTLPSELQLDVGRFCFEHDLTRHETKVQLQEILDSILPVRARAATDSAFTDFATYMARISRLEQLRRSNTPSRSCRTRKQLYLDAEAFPFLQEKPSALHQLSNLGA
ncbi:hypothetical protein O6H91_08G109900 [Diphasiastrum complanatum]|uniref:Uncharacterized protein n=3 Tax=Diphasiastrum complanatum TaxID=34168 RepID=A0ACC2D114_DIPCM|nr:hypothetical protein O6H91_08G109900 [Diphasiastrum complanatum]